jgi:hypothetical protein
MASGPRLTLVTPCSRPKLLKEVLKSIKLPLIAEWIIVHTHQIDHQTDQVDQVQPVNYLPSHEKISELYMPSNTSGSWGNPERNRALQHIPPERQGFLYYLDDDTLVHPNLYIVTQDLPSDRIHFFNEMDEEGHLRLFEKCQVYWVDTGVIAVDVGLAKQYIWDNDKHEADGRYIEDMCRGHPHMIHSWDLVAGYHNGQYIKATESEL